MEEHLLDTPLVTPPVSTTRVRVVVLTLDLEARLTPPAPPGLVLVVLRDEHGVRQQITYTGTEATDLIVFLNKANLSTKSLHKRILEKLEADHKIPPGTIIGAPDGTLPPE
jgi:hypothetical protein